MNENPEVITVAIKSPESLITFSRHNSVVMTITNDGRLVPGEGLSNDAATRECFNLLMENFKFEWNTRAALEKENELLRTKVLEMDQTIFNLRYPGMKISGLPQ